MPEVEDVRRLYTRRAGAYVRFVEAVRHRQALCSLLVSSTALGRDQRILDAGCGSGLSILALTGALGRRRLQHQSIDGFDLTPAMLERCTAVVRTAGIPRVQLRQADVLSLADQLPGSWAGYDLIICVSMLEYVPRHLLPAALVALRERLGPGSRLLAVITRSSFYPVRWNWRCQGYSSRDLRAALNRAGFTDVTFRHYPWAYGWLNIGNHVIEASAPRHS